MARVAKNCGMSPERPPFCPSNLPKLAAGRRYQAMAEVKAAASPVNDAFQRLISRSPQRGSRQDQQGAVRPSVAEGEAKVEEGHAFVHVDDASPVFAAAMQPVDDSTSAQPSSQAVEVAKLSKLAKRSSSRSHSNRRVRRACRKAWAHFLDAVFWITDTLRVWDTSSGTGISASGRMRASVRTRLYRWLFMIGGTVMSVLLIIWNTSYLNTSFAVSMFELGIIFGLVAGIIRAVVYHNRWLCYRSVPKRSGRTNLVNVLPKQHNGKAPGMGDVVQEAMGTSLLNKHRLQSYRNVCDACLHRS